MGDGQPSRVLLIIAGLLTQLLGGVCLVLALASLPVVHDLHGGTKSALASVIAALGAIVCGTLVWRGRLVPLALATGLDVGLGIVLPRGTSGIGSLLRILPQNDIGLAETLLMLGAVGLFIAATLNLVAIPSAIKLRQWARDELAKPSTTPADHLPEERKSGTTLRGWGTMKLVPTQVIRAADAPPRSKPVVIFAVAIPLIAVGIAVISVATGGKAAKDDLAFGAPGSSNGSPSVGGSSNGSSSVGSSSVGSSSVGGPSVGGPSVGDAAVGGPSVGGPAGGGATVGGAADGGSPVGSAASGAATGGSDAAAMGEASIEDFVGFFHSALGAGDAAAVGALLDDGAFGFGIDAHEVSEGREAVAAMLVRDLGGKASIAARFHQVGREGDVAWVAEELRARGTSFVTTYVCGLRDGQWSIAAIHFALAMTNAEAYKAARDGDLAVPDAIPGRADESALALAMKTAFASRASFVEARSARSDAFNFGSAPGEHVSGGETIKKIFGRLRATVRLHDAVRVGQVGARGGWGAANVDFTDADRDGTDVTQTFRVLAAWVQEPAGWRIVQTQWSNAR